MNYLQIEKTSVTAGPGVRAVLWVSGCRNHCEGCHNPESWNFQAGKKFGLDEIEKIIDYCNHDYISGLTFCGGEPMEEENQQVLSVLAGLFKATFPNKTLWCFTGYNWEDLMPGGKKWCHVKLPATEGASEEAKEDWCTDQLLNEIDVLVVGPFCQAQRDISDNNRWRGSRNQRVIDVKKSLEVGIPLPLDGIPNNDITYNLSELGE